MRIKICGLTRAADVAVAAGTDVLGFVFVPCSPRCLDASAAGMLCRQVPAFVFRVGLFLNQDARHVRSVLKQVPLNLLQFHGDEDAEYCRQFGLPYIKAISIQSGQTVAAAAGVDGILMVDCPPGKMTVLGAALARDYVFTIYLLAPTTTPDRVGLTARQARGYLYYVSFKGITGADGLDPGNIAAPLDEIRRLTSLPLAVGFGIKWPKTAAAVAQVADAVVIGSALVQTLAGAASLGEARRLARTFLAPVRAAMDNGAA